MQAWRIHEYGEASDVLRLDKVPDPEVEPGGVVVDLAYTAINFPDVLLCRGEYQERPDLPFTPGVEASGTVTAVGSEVTDLKPGDRVIAMPPPPYGGLAERLSVGRGNVRRVPQGMPMDQAAAFSLTYHTAYMALHRRTSVRPGDVVLIHGGAGGVGSAAIDLARAAGATVIATAGGEDKVKVCKELGAHHAIDYTTDEGFIQQVKDLTDGQGADIVLDSVGGKAFDDSRRCIAFEGTIVVIGFASGEIPQAPTNHVLVKNYTVAGLHHGLYRRRRPDLVDEAHEELSRLATEGAISPHVGRTVPFADAPSAIEALANRQAIGKVVVEVAGS